MKYCPYCGKQVADEAVICLNCGCGTQRASGSLSVQQSPPKNREQQLAEWSKICGIISFFIGWFALGIAAMIMAFLSTKDTDGSMCASAKVGLTCGTISTAFSLILFIALFDIIQSLEVFI